MDLEQILEYLDNADMPARERVDCVINSGLIPTPVLKVFALACIEKQLELAKDVSQYSFGEVAMLTLDAKNSLAREMYRKNLDYVFELKDFPKVAKFAVDRSIAPFLIESWPQHHLAEYLKCLVLQYHKEMQNAERQS